MAFKGKKDIYVVFARSKDQLPACPSTNGTLDFPCLHIFKLKTLRASKAPPNKTPVLRVVGFLENTNPRRPPLRTRPPKPKAIQKFASVTSIVLLIKKEIN